MANKLEPRPIALSPHIENMRNRHLRLMQRTRSASAKLKSTPEERAEARKEYKQLRHDLIEFDTYFINDNFVQMYDNGNFSTKEGVHIVSLEDGVMYKSINEAARMLGENRDTLRRSMLTPDGTCHGCHWRYYDKNMEYIQE